MLSKRLPSCLKRTGERTDEGPRRQEKKQCRGTEHAAATSPSCRLSEDSAGMLVCDGSTRMPSIDSIAAVCDDGRMLSFAAMFELQLRIDQRLRDEGWQEGFGIDISVTNTDGSAMHIMAPIILAEAGRNSHTGNALRVAALDLPDAPGGTGHIRLEDAGPMDIVFWDHDATEQWIARRRSRR